MEKNLNMPKTEFSQRSNSQLREPELLKLWQTVFMDRNEQNTKKTYVLHDGPPYANGDVHVGHVLNKVLKDMVSKYHLMSGHKVDFRPGWDCHGLPTELGVQKKYGELSTSELREKCENWANEFTEKQMNSFKSLGVLADWDNKYQTMDKTYEVPQLKVLYTLLNNGMLYMDKRPVYYSPSTRTVLAESELEYKDRTDTSAYFTLKTDDGTLLLLWTTQPWTVLGNVAVCVNPEFDYLKVKHNNKTYLLSKSSLHLLGEYEVLSELKGAELSGLNYTNELNNTHGVVVCDKFVKDNSGTGLVHLCPAHGEEDYEVCKRYGLVGEDLTDKGGKVNGLFCLDECTNYVVEEMSKNGMLFSSQKYKHSYPHDWRTGKPVYYKLTEQFFLYLNNVKEKALEALNTVEFSEEKWKNRLNSMLKNRDRWCLSRQRKWGFPLAVFLKDGKPFLNSAIETHLYDMFSKYGSSYWFNTDVNDMLPDEFKNMGLEKCEYTLDVWFDSGVSWLSVVNGQSDLYFEGSDQHRGWFQSSLLTSVAMGKAAPYKKLFTHGFVLDENGRKMSKSEGNVVLPKTVQEKYNTDVLRLWTAVVTYSDDVQLGDRVLKSCSEYYFKLRNTLKYMLGNMYGYDLNYVPTLNEKDKKALSRCDEMYSSVLNGYETLNFRKSFESLMSWVSEFSSQYLDLETKSYLYEYDVKSDERLTCQYVMKYCLEKYMFALAPMCSFLAEDAYQNYLFKNKYSVFMENL